VQEGHHRELDKLRKRADDLQADHNLLTDELTTLRKDKAVLELEVAQLMKRVRLRPYARPAPCGRFDAELRHFCPAMFPHRAASGGRGARANGRSARQRAQRRCLGAYLGGGQGLLGSRLVDVGAFLSLKVGAQCSV